MLSRDSTWLGLVQDVSIEQAYKKALEILRPKSRWISLGIGSSRILEMGEKPTVMGLIRSDGLWNVYDLRLVAKDIPNWAQAKRLAEGQIAL